MVYEMIGKVMRKLKFYLERGALPLWSSVRVETPALLTTVSRAAPEQ